jgi:hypothetical protein
MNDRFLSALRVVATSAFVLAFLPSAQAHFAGNSAARPSMAIDEGALILRILCRQPALCRQAA